MNLVIIPTFNRSYKLARVLEFYASHSPSFRVVVLDGSDDPRHQRANAQSAGCHSAFVQRLAMPEERNVVHRLLKFIDHTDEQVIALGNDEDAFFPQFLDMAFAHLRAHPEYATATGRYVTSARPLLGLRRISFWTDTFLGMHLDQDDPALRVVHFQRCNSAGVPPLFWSVRRKDVFVRSMQLGAQLQYASAQELIDQINTCVMGKVLISDMPMLLRDESRFKYVPERNRDEGKLYIGRADLAAINRIAAESWNRDVGVAVRAVTDWFAPQRDGESFETRLNARVYCRFSVPQLQEGSRLLALLRRCIWWSCVAGNLVAQFFAYAYYLRYMTKQRKGRLFLRMTRTIAVNK